LSEGQNIIGFTEAELGLVIAVLFIAVAIWKNPLEEPQPAKTTAVKPDPRYLQSKLDAERIHTRELEDKLRHLQLAAKDNKDLRSRQKPTCKEKGVASGDLLNAVVLGPDRFQVGQNTYDLGQLLKSVAPDMEAAKQAGCLHTIRIYYAKGIGIDDFDQGRRVLRNHFYGDSFGPEPIP
jgi:hypothetical protein